MNGLPGPESVPEGLDSSTEGNAFGQEQEAASEDLTDAETGPVSLFDLMDPDRVAPCELNERETSGDGDAWPGSPCLIENELCLTCSAKTARGKRMIWEDESPVFGSEVWRSVDGHDEWCEGDYDEAVHRYYLCGCADRARTGDYPDGRREPE